jgi:type II secretory pathway component PulF
LEIAMALDLKAIDAAKEPASRRKKAPSPVGEELEAQPLERFRSIQLFRSNKVALDELFVLTRQLSLLLKTGNALVPSVGALSTQACSPSLRQVLRQVHAHLEGGGEFSDALARHPKVFDSLFVSLVRAGEATGSLEESFDRIAGILETRRQLRARIREAMTYPMVLGLLMIVVVIFMLIFVVPRFAEIFQGSEDELPFSTLLFLGLSNFLRSSWWMALTMAILACVGLRWLGRTEALWKLWDRLKMSIPVVGKVYEESYVFQLCSSLGMLLGSHVPHLEAIGIARNAIRSSHYRDFFQSLSRNVEAGRGFSLAFQESKFLPDSVKLMVSTGETSGALSTVFTRLAERYREILERDVRRLGALLEPIMLLVMGMMVGFIAVSFILPIFRMSRALH